MSMMKLIVLGLLVLLGLFLLGIVGFIVFQVFVQPNDPHLSISIDMQYSDQFVAAKDIEVEVFTTGHTSILPQTARGAFFSKLVFQGSNQDALIIEKDGIIDIDRTVYPHILRTIGYGDTDLWVETTLKSGERVKSNVLRVSVAEPKEVFITQNDAFAKFKHQKPTQETPQTFHLMEGMVSSYEFTMYIYDKAGREMHFLNSVSELITSSLDPVTDYTLSRSGSTDHYAHPSLYLHPQFPGSFDFSTIDGKKYAFYTHPFSQLSSQATFSCSSNVEAIKQGETKDDLYYRLSISLIDTKNKKGEVVLIDPYDANNVKIRFKESNSTTYSAWHAPLMASKSAEGENLTAEFHSMIKEASDSLTFQVLPTQMMRPFDRKRTETYPFTPFVIEFDVPLKTIKQICSVQQHESLKGKYPAQFKKIDQ